MTSKRDLGPVLAIAGLVVVLGALIAGFVLTGGPSDARDRRLDEMTMGRIMDVANIAQCAFNGAGTAPASIDEARQVRGWESQGDKPTLCSLGTTPDQIPVSTGSKPATAGDVTYETVSATHVRICSVFRRPSGSGEVCNGICLRSTLHPELEAPRPSAGLHCFELDLASAATPEPGSQPSPN